MLESDDVDHDRRRRTKSGPGQATAAGDRLVWHFVADMVNDFAWATAKKFVWRATRATIPGKGPVPIHMVYLPERAKLFANAGPITRHALEFYSKLWAPYPFPQLTLQDGPSAGMEYPMVINSNQGAADHETGAPVVADDGRQQRDVVRLDGRGLQPVHEHPVGRRRAQGAAPNLDGLGQSYGRTSGNEDEPPMMWNANYAGSMYGFQTYSQDAADALDARRHRRRRRGAARDERVREGVGASSIRRRGTTSFFMNNALKQDLSWFWYYWLWTTESVDGSIADVDDGRRHGRP